MTQKSDSPIIRSDSEKAQSFDAGFHAYAMIATSDASQGWAFSASDLHEWLIQICFELELDVRLRTKDLLCQCLDRIEDLYEAARSKGSEALKRFQVANRDWIEFHMIGKILEEQYLQDKEKPKNLGLEPTFVGSKLELCSSLKFKTVLNLSNGCRIFEGCESQSCQPKHRFKGNPVYKGKNR